MSKGWKNKKMIYSKEEKMEEDVIIVTYTKGIIKRMVINCSSCLREKAKNNKYKF